MHFKNLLFFVLLFLFSFISKAQPFGDCINFNGQNDFYTIPDNGTTDFVNTLSIEAWIRPCDTIDDHTILSKVWCYGDQSAYYFSMVDGGKLRFMWEETGYCNDSGNWYETDVPVIYNDVWQHVAVTFSQSEVVIYVNGVPVAGTVYGSFFPIHNSNQPIRVGTYHNLSGTNIGFWEGGMDELRIWSHVRSSSDILNEYNQLLQGSEIGLVVYHEMESITGGNVVNLANSTGTSNNGTWQSASTGYNVPAISLSCSGSTPLIITSVQTSDASGCGVDDGSISVVSIGDQFELYDAGPGSLISTNTSGVFSGLASGVYYVVAYLGTDSQQTQNIIINNLGGVLPIDIIISEPICYGQNNGSVNINVNGSGVDPGAAFVISDISGNQLNQNNSNAAEFLTSGWYYCYVDNPNGCDGFDSVYLDQPDSLYFTIGEQDPLCYNSSDGQAWIDQVFNAQGSYTVSWNGNVNGFDSIANLGNGNHSVLLVDSVGCSAQLDFLLYNQDTIVISSLSSDPSQCRGDAIYPGSGTVSATASGGTGSLGYLWTNGADTAITNTWGNRSPGWHYLTVTDGNGCSILDSIYVDSLNPIADFILDPNFGYSPLTVTITDQSINRTTNTWIFNDSVQNSVLVDYDSLQMPFDSIFKLDGTNEVCLIVSNDFECYDTLCQEVYVYSQVTLIIPNVITPNGDGINDEWMPFKEKGLQSIKCDIFNRWGLKVFEINNENEAFSGSDLNGNELSEGVYTYVYEGTGLDNNPYSGQGVIHILK